jgi:hypothetical protein
MKSYQKEVTNAQGEVITVNRFRYIEGEPKQYRYNSQSGQFNIDGDTPVLDKAGKPIKEFTFQPFVYRIFKDGLFNRSQELWAELFFVDAVNCVSSIMFNGTTLDELRKTMKKLLYEGEEAKTLCDVVLTIRPERVTSKNDSSKSWFIGRFSFETAEPQTVSDLAEYAADFPVYRADTLKQTASYLNFSESFALPQTDVLALPVADTDESADPDPEAVLAEVM